jgi:hypothetical protein
MLQSWKLGPFIWARRVRGKGEGEGEKKEGRKEGGGGGKEASGPVKMDE